MGVGRLRWWDVLGWWSTPPPSGSAPGPHWWVGVIPNKAAWGMLESALDPPSKLPFRRDWPHTPPAGSYTNEDDSLGPPSPEDWQSFWLWWWMASNEVDRQPKQFFAHKAQPIVHCPIGDWWLYPHFDPPCHTRGSGSPHWNGTVCPDHVCPSNTLPFGTAMGIWL